MLKLTAASAGTGLVSVIISLIIKTAFPDMTESDFWSGFFLGLAIVFLITAIILSIIEKRAKKA